MPNPSPSGITPAGPLPDRILHIGIIYDRAGDYEAFDGPADRFAEFEPETTIQVMEQAITEAGHRPVRIGSPHRLLENDFGVDLVWNIGEGYGTRNREAWAPVLCEMRGIPFLGSDAHTLTVTLDKALTKRIVRSLDIPVTGWQVIPYAGSTGSYSGTTGFDQADPGIPDHSDPEPSDNSDPGTPNHSDLETPPGLTDSDIPPTGLTFPLFLKPRYEGTAKGISAGSIVRNREEYNRQCRHLLGTYHQDVLAEPFLPGAELTCAMAGFPLRPLPVMERGLHSSGIGSHVAGSDSEQDVRTTNVLSPQLEEKIAGWSVQLSKVLEIRDFARFDYKLDAGGNPFFLEVNPLPTFAIDSTYAILAEMEGRPYPEWLAGILTEAIRRLRV